MRMRQIDSKTNVTFPYISFKIWELPFLIGILLWFPGIGFKIAFIYLQPIEILVLVWFIFYLFPSFILKGSLRLNNIFYMMFFLFLNWTISTILSTDHGNSIIYMLYYCGVIFPFMLLFYTIIKSSHKLVKFFTGFVYGGMLSSFVGIIQLATKGKFLSLINNQNFSLIKANKAYGFTPEASVLAGLFIILLTILILLLKSKKHRMFFRALESEHILQNINKLKICIVLVSMGFVSTFSTSVIIVFPLLIIVIYFALYKLNVFIKKIVSHGFLISLCIFLFYVIAWSDRVSSGDATGSMIMRVSSMIAALYLFKKHFLFGMGLGNIGENFSGLTEKIMNYFVSYGLPAKEGIDSFPLHLMVEQGIIVLGIYFFVIYCLVTAVRKKNFSQHPDLSLLALMSISILFVGTLTVGYRGLLHLWIVFPVSAYLRQELKFLKREAVDYGT